MKTALITGISGQDGYYLTRYLLNCGYKVLGTSRNCLDNSFINIKKLKNIDNVNFFSLDLNNFSAVYNFIQSYLPDEIYNLSGQSSVAASYIYPKETLDSNINAVINILDSLVNTSKRIRFFNAGSGECYGNIGDIVVNENSRFNPISPYAVSKTSAYYLIDIYRKAYNIFACTGILFNHESILRPEKYITRKIITTARKIYYGEESELILGNLNIIRDWGYANDYVEAMWKMLQLEIPQDFIIATGSSYSLVNFVDIVFNEFDLDWRKYVSVDEKFYRPLDIIYSKADPSLAQDKLNWHAKLNVKELIRKMIRNEI